MLCGSFSLCAVKQALGQAECVSQQQVCYGKITQTVSLIIYLSIAYCYDYNSSTNYNMYYVCLKVSNLEINI